MRYKTRDTRRKTGCLFVLCFLFLARTAAASDFDNAKNMIMSGQVEAGAQALARIVRTNPSPEALLLLGRSLDRLQDLFSERAEKTCYWGKSSSANSGCAQAEAEKLNSIYGAGAFKFITDIAYVPYTGIHYKEILSKYKGSKEAGEAEFQLLLKDLVGHPSVVLPKVKSFMDKHSSGELGRKAMLLSARVNQDIWYIHRSWSWVLYNEQFSPDELIVKAEPYRQEALKTFEKIAGKYSGTFEGKAAQNELSLLKNNQDDGETYSILQDSVGGSPDKWGSPIPKPSLTATQRGLGEPGWQQAPPAEASPQAPAKKSKTKAEPQAAPDVQSEPAGEKKSGSQRWE